MLSSKRFKFLIPHIFLRQILCDYFLGLSIFFILRISFLIFNHGEASSVSGNLIAIALFKGIQFDSVSCGMILIFPWLILFAGLFFQKQKSKFQTIAFLLTQLFFTLAFFAAFADMPLFIQFGKRISVAALHWSSSPGFILHLICTSPRLILLIVSFFAFGYLFYRIRKKISTRIINSSVAPISKFKTIGAFLLIGGLLLLTIRGRVALKSPIRWGTAYFCENTFANQLVLNPFYTFVTSAFESINHQVPDYHTMSDLLAKEILRKNSSSKTPLLLKPEGEMSRPTRNVVIVIMESMAGWKTGLYPDGLHWTNNLDSLAKEGMFFSNFYSDGIHTFNGLYATLTGNQSLPKIQPLSDMNIIDNPTTIAEELKSHGYHTLFFTTHDVEFDNMNGFMRQNGYDQVIGEPDYKISTGMNPMGVPDHLMFEFVHRKINTLAKIGNPFLISIMTGSDHEPFIIPEHISFAPHGNDEHENAARYADWSIGQFMSACKKESWYSNTVFVFVADHGGIPVGAQRDMYLAFHHIPCIIIGPEISPSVNSSLGTQADILPTLMDVLGNVYENKSMGIDLLRQKRDKVYFTYDEEVCVLDSNSFYVQREIDPHLFLRNEKQNDCVRIEDKEIVKSDLDYLNAMLQVMSGRFYFKN